ncbi:MAG: ABC transporter substrate-binding protein [Pseudomonadota bacterium]
MSDPSLSRRRFVALLAGAGLAGCMVETPAPVRIGVNPWVGYDPLVLARERGWAAPDRVRVVELASNTESTRALRNGLLEGAALTLDEALRLHDAGVPLRIVAVLDVSHGADAVLGARGLTDPAQLKGRRVALEETALGALVLHRLLSAAGLGPDDVRTLHVEASHHVAVLERGMVDAVITFEPMKRQLEAQGYPVLFDSTRMRGEIIDVLAVRAEIDRRRIEPVLAAWQQGLAEFLAHPAEASTLLAPGTGLTPEEYLVTLRGLHFYDLAGSLAQLSGHPPGLGRMADGLVGVLLRQRLVTQPPDWASLLDPGPARAVLEQGRKP